MLKRLGPYAGAAFVLSMAALVNPHNLIYDWGTAFVVVLLLRRSDLIPPKYAELAVGALAISLFAAGEIAWDVRYSLYVVRPLTALGRVRNGWAADSSLLRTRSPNGPARTRRPTPCSPSATHPSRSAPAATRPAAAASAAKPPAASLEVELNAV